MTKTMIFFSMLMFAFSTAFGQHQHDDHKHGSTHGGIVKSAGKEFHIELNVKDGIMMAYLLNAKEEALMNTDLTATALLQTSEGKTSNVTLTAYEKDGFKYTLDKTKKYNKAIVTILSGGKTATATFDLAKPAPVEAKPHHHD